MDSRHSNYQLYNNVIYSQLVKAGRNVGKCRDTYIIFLFYTLLVVGIYHLLLNYQVFAFVSTFFEFRKVKIAPIMFQTPRQQAK